MQYLTGLVNKKRQQRIHSAWKENERAHTHTHTQNKTKLFSYTGLSFDNENKYGLPHKRAGRLVQRLALYRL